MDYKQKYLKYKQKYLNLLKDQKGGEPFLIDLLAKQAQLWLLNKNQRQLELIFTRRQNTLIMPLGNVTLNHQHRLRLLAKGGLSVLLVSRLLVSRNMQLAKRILSRLHVLPPISHPTSVATIREPTHYVESVAFHPTLPLLASGSRDATVKIWDCSIPQNTHLVADLTEHTGTINSLAFHPTFPLLASGSADITLKLWDCTNRQNPTLVEDLNEHNRAVRSVAFHLTLPLLASGSMDGTVKLWQ